MIITIDIDEVVDSLLEDGVWKEEDFREDGEPFGWSNELLDAVPEYEEAVYKEIQERFSNGNCI